MDIILGRPWLVQHDPHLSWRTGEVLKWGEGCFPHCFPRLPRPLATVPVQLPVHSTSIESPVEKQSVNIPSSYSHFSDVFCPKKAAQLPPHRPWDCAIDLHHMMYLLHRKKIDIYANISLFVSYSEVTAFTRSDGGSAPRDDLYSPERQWRPGHLDEPQRQIPSEDPVT